MPRLFAATAASTARPVVSPSCSLIAFNNRKLFSSKLPSQHHPTPPGSPHALLGPSRSGVGHFSALLRLLLERCSGFWRLGGCSHDPALLPPLLWPHPTPRLYQCCLGVLWASSSELSTKSLKIRAPDLQVSVALSSVA